MIETIILSNGLDCSPSYAKATPKQRKAVCNGIGPGWMNWILWLFPFRNYIFLIKIKECGDIHDWDYTTGGDEQDRLLYDERLEVNMTQRIDSRARWPWQRNVALKVAAIYKWVVNYKGSKSFNYIGQGV